MIICHVGFTADPINNVDRREVRPLASISGSQISLYADAVDSEDANASFSFAWALLNPRTGQTASITNSTSAIATLENFAGVWGDLRVFCVATNTATSTTSEADPLAAPETSFCTVALTSSERALTLPAIGSRDWYLSADAVSTAVENLNLPTGISSASVNAGGELILTLTDNSTINAGSVVGPAGADGSDGADGADGAAGPAQHEFEFTSTVNHWFDTASRTVQTGFQPTKDEVIAGPFLAPVNIDLLRLNVAVRDMGAVNNSATFTVFTCSPAQWATLPVTTSSTPLSVTLGPTTSANIPASGYVNQPSSLVVSAGQLFGLLMGAPSEAKIYQISVDIYARRA